MHFIWNKMKKLIAMMTAAILLVLIPGVGSFTSHADDPVTYSVIFKGGDVNDWRYEVGSTITGSGDRELNALLQVLKDGDLVVVYAGDDTSKALDLGNVKLANLTIYNNARAIVFTGGIRECYVLAGAYCAVNGDVTYASLYDNTTCTFNDNVLDMTLYFDTDTPSSNISCNGTVGHFNAHRNGVNNSYFDFYDISKGKLLIKDGTSQVPSDAYKPEPTSEYLAATGQAQTPSTAASTNNDDEYDHVPKTGETRIYIWLLFASVLCFTGSSILRKKETR